MDREIDPFAKIEISIEFNFDRLEKVKTKFIGDGIVTFVTKIHLDYKNKWGKNKTDRFLYKLYQKIMKWKFESMYIVPGVIEGNQLYGYIKDELEEYSKESFINKANTEELCQKRIQYLMVQRSNIQEILIIRKSTKTLYMDNTTRI